MQLLMFEHPSSQDRKQEVLNVIEIHCPQEWKGETVCVKK